MLWLQTLILKQLEKRKLTRLYTAIVWGNPSPSKGTIKTNIGRSKRNRQKMSVLGEGAGKEGSVTDCPGLERKYL